MLLGEQRPFFKNEADLWALDYLAKFKFDFFKFIMDYLVFDMLLVLRN
jgi:hypothetical protein